MTGHQPPAHDVSSHFLILLFLCLPSHFTLPSPCLSSPPELLLQCFSPHKHASHELRKTPANAHTHAPLTLFYGKFFSDGELENVWWKEAAWGRKSHLGKALLKEQMEKNEKKAFLFFTVKQLMLRNERDPNGFCCFHLLPILANLEFFCE